MDEMVDPCDNFYEFACGSFIKNTPIPPERATVDSFSIAQDLIYDQIKTIINEPILPNELKPFKMAKYFYQACMNQLTIESRGIKPLADLLEAHGGWPVINGDSWSEETFNWVEMLKKIRISGLETSIIFELSVNIDPDNSSRHVLYVSSYATYFNYFYGFT